MHLELGVLWTSQADAAAAVNLRGWDEPAAPIAHDDEEVIESSLFQSLDDAVPASVAASGAGCDDPAVSLEER